MKTNSTRAVCRFLSLLLTVCFLLPSLAHLLVFAADEAWTVKASFNVTNPGTGENTTIRGKTVNLDLTFTTQEYSEDLLVPYEFYLKDGFFDEVGHATIPFVNQSIGGNESNGNIFESTIDRVGDTPEIINGEAYYKYRIAFNASDDAKDYYAGRKPGAGALTSAILRISLTVSQKVTQIPGDILYSDETSGVIDIDGTPPKPVDPTSDDGRGGITKYIHAQFRKQADGTYAVIADGNDTTITDAVIEKDDILVFRIRVVNWDQAKNVRVKEIGEKPGAGYVPYYGGNPFDDSNVILQSKTLKQLIADLPKSEDTYTYPGGTDVQWDAFWKLDGGVYKHVFADDGILLSYNQTASFFFVAKASGITTGNAADDEKIKNTAYIKTNNENDREGSISPTTQNEYDLALQVYINAIYNSDRELKYGSSWVGNVISEAEQRKVLAGDYVMASATVLNQGKSPVDTYRVYLYVPEGLELSRDSSVQYYNDKWTEASNNTYDWDNADGQWSKLKVYYTDRTLKTVKEKPMSSNVREYYSAILKVQDQNPAKELDYYLGAEIGYFALLDRTDPGLPVLKWEGEDITKNYLEVLPGGNGGFSDVDSTPDARPLNDFDPADAKVALNVQTKEEERKIDGKARINSGEDEDDFDFAQLILIQPGGTPGSEPALTKTRIEGDALNSSLRKVLDGTPYTQFVSKYEPISSDGYIIKRETFILYEIWVNKTGKETIDSALLNDVLPKGLMLYSYQYDGKTFYGIDVEKYVGSPKDADGNIIYQPPTMYVSKSIQYKNTSGLDDKPNHVSQINNWAGRASSAADQSALYGVNIGLYDVEGALSGIDIQFAEPQSGSGSTNFTRDTDAAYRILLLAVVDPDALSAVGHTTQVVTNKVTMTLDGESKTITEDKQFYWNLSASSTYASKYVMVDGEKRTNASVVPDENGNASINYRIRVRAVISGTEAHDANVLNTVDSFDAGIVDSVENIVVTGYRSKLSSGHWKTDGELNGSGANAPLELLGDDRNVSATYDGQTHKLNIANHNAIGKNELYNIDFTVHYKNLPYGKPIQNIAGTVVYTAVPMNLAIKKVDSGGAALSDYEFEAYYYDETAQGPDMAKPVNRYGTAAGLTDNKIDHQHPSLAFLPEGYSPYEGGSKEFKIVLVETKAPSGYYGKDSQLLVTIKTDSDGVLYVDKVEQIALVTSPAQYKSQALDADGTITLTIADARITGGDPDPDPDPKPPVTPPVTPPDKPDPTDPPVTPPGDPDPTDPTDPPVTPPTPPTPTGPGNTLVPTDDGGYEEIDEDGTPLGKWTFDPEEEIWIFDEYPPLGEAPATGDQSELFTWALTAVISAVLILCLMTVERYRPKYLRK